MDQAPRISSTATGTAGLLSVLLPIVWARYFVHNGWPELGPEVWGPIALGLLVLLHKLVTRLELASDRRFALRVLAAGFYPFGTIPGGPGSGASLPPALTTTPPLTRGPDG